jgi:hypothetical protein
MDIFFSLPFPAGMANAPKNVMKTMISTEPDFGLYVFLALFFSLLHPCGDTI